VGNYPDLCEHSPSTPLESWECVHCFGYRPVTPPGSEKTRHTIQTNRILSRNRGTGYFQINHHLKQTHPSKNDDLKSRKFSRCIENKNAGTQPRIVHTFIVQWAHRICPTPEKSTSNSNIRCEPFPDRVLFIRLSFNGRTVFAQPRRSQQHCTIR